MHHNTKLYQRFARLRAPLLATLLLALGACDGTNSLDPASSGNADLPTGEEGLTLDDPGSAEDGDLGTDTLAVLPADGLSLSSRYAGGIPIGTFAMPTRALGSRYNGAMRNIYPQYLLRELSGIKARGGKVVLMMAGNQRMYRDGSGHFSFTKWKQRINRYRGVNFNSYIKDGTVIGHYLIDEPNDPNNWNGRKIPPATVEAMAKYSKQLWPGMPTIVRTYPEYLATWSGNYRYLDAAWAQYVSRFGNVDRFIEKNIALARKKGLGLVVGLNVLKGGPNKRKMTPTQVKTWGSALLSSSYPCAFISWTYNSTYLNSKSMQAAMSHLRNKAENRGARSCRG